MVRLCTLLDMPLEIEQRYAIDIAKVQLPREYKVYQQAEMPGKKDVVIPAFFQKVEHLLKMDGFSSFRGSIESFLKTKEVREKIKIRVRMVFDPSRGVSYGELTRKIKLASKTGNFKVYDEENLTLPPELVLGMIEKIARRNTCGEICEYGVRKHRYIITGPDGKKWDVDALQGLNNGVHLGEIEVDDENTSIIPIPGAMKRISGDDRYKFLGTAELQEIPWHFLDARTRMLYVEALKPSI